MRNCVFFSIMLLLLFSCKEKHPYPRVILPKQKNVIMVNSSGMLHITFSNGIISNFTKNTIINPNSRIKSEKEDYLIASTSDTVLPKYNFKIIVDTSYTFHKSGFEYYNITLPDKSKVIIDGLINGKEPTDKQIEISRKEVTVYSKSKTDQWDRYLECYPLLIFNNGIQIALANDIALIQEARDIDGIWKPIEFFEGLPYCVGHNYFYKYKPKKYSVFSIIKYYGKYKTKLRLKVKIGKYSYYSNEFYGSINRSQFSLDYMRKYINLFKNYDDKYLKEYEEYVLLKKN